MYIFHIMAKEITLSKGNLCIYKCFIGVLYILTLALKKNLKNEHRFESDLALNFAMPALL